jgi:hypothetical protein
VLPDLWSRCNSTTNLQWAFRPRLAIAPPNRLEHLTAFPTRTSRPKADSKRDRDRLRSIQRNMVFEGQRRERLRLFGHVKLKNGEVISIDEASTRLKASLTQNPNKRILPILPEDIDEWHAPESFTDTVLSIGEVDCLDIYPALGLFPGVVLRDPKLRYVDQVLRRE